nr:MAG TPA: hypothetical protein [Caudoviricetes sp.]
MGSWWSIDVDDINGFLTNVTSGVASSMIAMAIA